MSDLSLHFGQCGNQIGSRFIDSMYNIGDSRERWFYDSNNGDYARSLLIDAETKVTNSLLHSVKKWKFRKENVIVTSGGSGNNWALGYCFNGPKLEESIMEALRKESERCDNMRSITCFLSSGGGTGSGVGSFIIEKVRDYFPNNYIVCNLVIPFPRSESPVHSYNTVLSLSKLYETCDAIITFYNDFLFKQCTNLYKDTEFKFDELNNIIAKQLTSLFRSYDQTFFVPHYISNLVPLNSYKLISLKSCPFIKENSTVFETPMLWKSLVERLKAMLIKTNDNFWDYQEYGRIFSESRQKSSTYYNSLGNMVICNGKGARSAKQHAMKCFQNDILYSSRSSSSHRFVYLADEAQFHNQLQFSTVATNSGVFINRLNKITDGAWFSYIKNAYCHHFQKYGLQDREFSLGFLKIETVIKLYDTL